MTEEIEYTTIRISNETKTRFEEARAKAPYEEAKTADEFILHLLENQNKKTK